MTSSLKSLPNPARKDLYESLIPKTLLIAVEAKKMMLWYLAKEILELDNSITKLVKELPKQVTSEKTFQIAKRQSLNSIRS